MQRMLADYKIPGTTSIFCMNSLLIRGWYAARVRPFSSGKIQACSDPILEFRGQGSGKHVGRAQLLELFWCSRDNGSKGTTFKKQEQWATLKLCFVGRAPKRYILFERIWNQSEAPSIYPSVYLSLSTIFIYLTISKTWIHCCLKPQLITVTLVSCYISSQSDPFPLCLGKNVHGMRRSVTTPNSSQKPSLYKIRISGPTNQKIATKIASLYRSGTWVHLNWP